MPKHIGPYDVFAADPAPGSVHAFHDVVVATVDDDVDPPLALGPVEITEDMHPDFRAWAERHNPDLRRRQERQREWSHNLLQEVGFTRKQIENPSDGMFSLLKWLHGGLLALDHFLDQHIASRPPLARPARYKRILAMAYVFCGSSPTAAALFLNVGSRREGLQRHHVFRANKSFRQFFLGRSEGELRLEFVRSANLWLAAERLRQDAAKHPCFMHYKGAELALAIDQERGLLSCLDKAADILDERGALLPYTSAAA